MAVYRRVTALLCTVVCLAGLAVAAPPGDDCDCSDPRDFVRCQCADELDPDRVRIGDGPAKRSPPGGADEAVSSVFRWGKRQGDADRALNAVFRWGKRADDGLHGNVFRWGKRSAHLGDDLPGAGDLDRADAADVKRIFRWGKRAEAAAAADDDDDDASPPQLFRWGKRAGGGAPAAVFRWGKRSREAGNPPVFRWGKRDYIDDLDTHLRTLSLLQWPGKRIDDRRVASDAYAPVFRWGKRQAEGNIRRGNTAGLFRWGKRDTSSAPEPNNELEHYSDS